MPSSYGKPKQPRVSSRGRPAIINGEQEFLEHYGSSNSMEELAVRLGCTVVTAYKYCNMYKLPHIKSMIVNSKYLQTQSLIHEFKGTMTVKELAELQELPIKTVRSRLRRAIKLHFKDTRKYPAPERIVELRIYNLLCEDESFWDKPEEVAQLTRLPIPLVERYLERVFQHTGKYNIDELPI